MCAKAIMKPITLYANKKILIRKKFLQVLLLEALRGGEKEDGGLAAHQGISSQRLQYRPPAWRSP